MRMLRIANNINFRTIVLILLILVFAFSFISFVQAERMTNPGANPDSYCDCERTEDGWNCSKCMCQGSNVVTDCQVGWLMSDPVCACCGDCTLTNFLGLGVNITKIILKYLGVIALLFFVIGGVVWISSGGSAEKVKQGKDIIKASVIGMVIVIGAVLIVRLFGQALGVDMGQYLPASPAGDDQIAAQDWPDCPAGPPPANRAWCYGCGWTGGSRGCQGSEVKTYQQVLNGLNCDCGEADGMFGSITKACTKRFQQANGLSVDGMVGPDTWNTYQGDPSSCSP